MNIENQYELETYLGERVESRVLAGGVSNRTVEVKRESGETWVLKQALEKLRVPVDWFCSPERIIREALGMETLAQVAPAGAITRLIFCDPAEHVLAMEAVPEPHANWKELLLSGVVEMDHFRQFGVLLATFRNSPHRVEFDDQTFFEALRLEPYYAYSASQVPPAASFISALIGRTRATHEGLVHGDYSPKNVLIHKGKLVLLDHEVIHWGDPAFDVGFAMTHFLSKASHLPACAAGLKAGARTFLEQLPVVGAAELDHTLACLLARGAGRSQLEYLSAGEKRQQVERVLGFIEKPPPNLFALVDAW